MSGINGVLRDLGADALVMLCDLNRIGADEDFDVFSVAWFPSHVGALDLASAHALRARRRRGFDDDPSTRVEGRPSRPMS